jgi:hypothetical protein
MKLVSDIFKTIFGASFIVISRILFITLFSILINYIFYFIYLYDLINSLFRSGETGSFLHDHLAIAILVFILCTSTFLLGFPFVYFFTAKTYAIRKAISFAYHSHKETLFIYFVQKLAEKKEKDSGFWKHALQFGNKADYLLDKTPWAIRMIFNFLFETIPVREAFKEATAETPLSSENAPIIANKMIVRLDKEIQSEVLNPGLYTILAVILINIAAFVLIIKVVLL